MNCHNHPLRQGVNTCSKCGKWLCDECSVERDGRIYCKGCLAGGGGERAETRARTVPNILLLLLFSGLPGANYMYMGLIKRGLFVMTSFFVSVYMTDFFWFFGFVSAGIFITSFFDGLRIRRKFLCGEHVSDHVDDLKAFFAENKFAIIGSAAVLIVMQLVSEASTWLYRGMGHMGRMHEWGFSRGIFAIAAIALGCYFLSKARSKKTSEPKDRDIQ